MESNDVIYQKEYAVKREQDTGYKFQITLFELQLRTRYKVGLRRLRKIARDYESTKPAMTEQ
jgi:hypothetical protein